MQSTHNGGNTSKGFECALIGMGRIGLGIAQLLQRSGHQFSAYDPHPDKVLDDTLHKQCKLFKSFDDFCASLGQKCIVFICIPSGEHLDEVLVQLLMTNLLDLTVVDLGNSSYEDSIRRHAKLKASGVRFVDIGVSGGVGIAGNGACLMVGGGVDDFTAVRSILCSLKSVGGQGSSPAHLGHVGTGHFVKMIHNGIEYAFMQLWSEYVYFHLNINKLSFSQVAERLNRSEQRTTSGYLLNITMEILGERDSNGDPLLKRISDFCGANGTGTLTAITALKYGIPCNVLATAVECRQFQDYRESRNGEESYPIDTIELGGDRDDELLQALGLAYACAFTQGLLIIKAVSAAYDWNLDTKRILDIWRNGSIIRGDWIDELISKSLSESFQVTELLHGHLEKLPSLRRVVAAAVCSGYAMPCHSAALSYLDSILMVNSWTPLLSAQRDYFGGHGFRMRGSCEIQRWNWSKC